MRLFGLGKAIHFYISVQASDPVQSSNTRRRMSFPPDGQMPLGLPRDGVTCKDTHGHLLPIAWETRRVRLQSGDFCWVIDDVIG